MKKFEFDDVMIDKESSLWRNVCLEHIDQHVGYGMRDELWEWFSGEQCTVCFTLACNEDLNIHGWPVEVLYDKFQGLGTYKARYESELTSHKLKAFEGGKKAAREAIAKSKDGGGHSIIEYLGTKGFEADFFAGLEAAYAEARGTVQ